MSHVIYVSGPMTGIPQLNYPLFNKVSAELRQAGFVVENPAENPDPPEKSWAGFMRMSLVQISRATILVRLPGWEASRGAVVENYLAEVLSLSIHDYLCLETFLEDFCGYR